MKGRIILNLDSNSKKLANITYLLSRSRINIEDINYVDTGERVIVDLCVDNPKKTIDILKKNNYEPQSPDKSLLISLKDEPGALFKISKLLDNEGVKLLKIKVITKGPKIAVLGIFVDKKRKAEKVLKSYLL